MPPNELIPPDLIPGDRTFIGLLSRFYFPLSVGWEEAQSGDAGRPAQHIRKLAAAYAAIEARWQEAFFGEELGEGPERALRLARLEAQRHRAAQAWAASRFRLLPRHLRRPWPAVRFRIPPPDAPPPEPPVPVLPETCSVERSAAFPLRGRRISFLRYPSADPLAPGPALARVVEPQGAPPALTVLFSHGIGMESEIWRLGSGIERGFARLGAAGDGAGNGTDRGVGCGPVRLVMLEGPGHGRRRTRGWYAGERILGQGPHALAGYLQASAEEIHLLLRDARRRWPETPVAFLGTSLGAIAMQRAVHPERVGGRGGLPDALCLVTPAADLVQAVLEGELTRALGVPQALEAAGWTAERAAELTDRIDPPAEPPLDPQRLVMKIAARDRVLLAGNGWKLARRWCLPAANVLHAPGGHFSAQLEIPRDPAVLARLLAVTAAASPGRAGRRAGGWRG